MEREIQIEIYNAFSIITTVGIYAANDSTAVSKQIKTRLYEEIKKYETITQMHGFFVDEAKKIVLFDLIFDFDEKNPHDIISIITETMKNEFPSFNFNVVLDTDFSD